MPANNLQIAMWSGPRNISTALMRSWGNRPDTVVCDEPLYAHYLLHTRTPHPGADEVIAHQETDWRKVAAWLTGLIPDGRAIFYQKHMAHHLLPSIERDWLGRLTHCFLIRDPREVLASLVKTLPQPTLADTGLPQQVALFDWVRRQTGTIPPVLDARDVLENPRTILGLLCRALGVDFADVMLTWPPGRRETDGIWAKYWYAEVERSTSFAPYRPKTEPLPSFLTDLYEECLSHYRTLHGYRLGQQRRRSNMLQSFNEKNRDLLVNINGRLVHRDAAGISPFDSSVQGGDAVWEGLRLYDGRIFKLTEHLDRLRSSALALAFSDIPSHQKITEEIRRTLVANHMRDGVHIRLTLTRGVKFTSGMDPRLNQSGPTLIVLAEHKPPVYDRGGITLITSSVRRFPPDCLDPKIHHCNLIQSILAKIQANAAGADDALMLDLRGFVAETNATHVFLVAGSTVLTSLLVACPEGITRATVLGLCRAHGIPHREQDLTLTEVYRAEEMFCTGTMGEIVPVIQVDGRKIGNGQPGAMTRRIGDLFRCITEVEGVSVVDVG
jgi:branched-subunit amino acid aminotransferase/4-amino-4-deoxychorismate lyase